MVLEIQEVLLTGTPICRGIAIGRPFFLTFEDDIVGEWAIDPLDIDMEIARYRRACARARDEIKALQKKLQKERAFDGVAILDAHLQVMDDSLFTTAVEEKIRAMQKNADFVFQGLINEFKEKCNSMPDPFFRDRLNDIQDLSQGCGTSP